MWISVNEMKRRHYPKSAKRRKKGPRCNACGLPAGLRGAQVCLAVRPVMVLCAEHAGMPVDYALMAVPGKGTDESACLFWDGRRRRWTPRRHLAKVYKRLDAAKAGARDLRPPDRRYTLVYYKLERPGPKDWSPGRAD